MVTPTNGLPWVHAVTLLTLASYIFLSDFLTALSTCWLSPLVRLCESVSRSVIPTLQPHGLWPTRLLSVHGISQARILEWVAIPFSRGSSQPRDQTWVTCIAGRFFTVWATYTSMYFHFYPHLKTHSLPPIIMQRSKAIICEGLKFSVKCLRLYPKSYSLLHLAKFNCSTLKSYKSLI